jgi:hypothetical protein
MPDGYEIVTYHNTIDVDWISLQPITQVDEADLYSFLFQVALILIYRESENTGSVPDDISSALKRYCEQNLSLGVSDADIETYANNALATEKSGKNNLARRYKLPPPHGIITLKITYRTTI